MEGVAASRRPLMSANRLALPVRLVSPEARAASPDDLKTATGHYRPKVLYLQRDPEKVPQNEWLKGVKVRKRQNNLSE